LKKIGEDEMICVKNYKKQRIFLLIIAVMVFLPGCKKNQHHTEEVTVKAYRLIDEQRTSEAIDLLEDVLKRNFKNNDVKFVLASAYAHKAGIKIQKLVPTITQLYKFKNFNKKINKVNKKPNLNVQDDTTTKSNSEVEISASVFLNKMAAVLDTFDAIPSVNNQQVEFLMHAIDLITSIGSQMTQEQALYKAILEVILFKYIIQESTMPPDNFEASIIDDKNCSISIKKLNESLVPLGKLLIETFTDMGLANPSQSNSMNKMSQEIKLHIFEFETIASTVGTLEELSSSYLKRSVIDFGFGKIIKCKVE
jgi:hypothetical protein